MTKYIIPPLRTDCKADGVYYRALRREEDVNFPSAGWYSVQQLGKDTALVYKGPISLSRHISRFLIGIPNWVYDLHHSH